MVADTNVLINLMHVGRADLLGKIPHFDFVITEQVAGEIEWPQEQEQLRKMLATGSLRVEPTSDLLVLSLFAELRHQMGAGEAAALALAWHRGWVVASDEKRAFRREAITRLGQDRLLTTPGIYILAIRSGLLTVEQADADKAKLEGYRFVMSFRSFQDVL